MRRMLAVLYVEDNAGAFPRKDQARASGISVVSSPWKALKKTEPVPKERSSRIAGYTLLVTNAWVAPGHLEWGQIQVPADSDRCLASTSTQDSMVDFIVGNPQPAPFDFAQARLNGDSFRFFHGLSGEPRDCRQPFPLTPGALRVVPKITRFSPSPVFHAPTRQ